MNAVHLQSALDILRAHAAERPYCEQTTRLIAETERRLQALLTAKGPTA